MILDRFRMDDKVAIVTGAGRGIGAAAASRPGPGRGRRGHVGPQRRPARMVAAQVEAAGRRAVWCPPT